MAGKVLYHVTMSLDGFIAGPGDAMDWVFKVPGAAPSAAGADVIATTSAILVGRRLYDAGISFPDRKPYVWAWTGPVFVLTHQPPEHARDPAIRFLSGSIQHAVVTALEAAGGKKVEKISFSTRRAWWAVPSMTCSAMTSCNTTRSR